MAREFARAFYQGRLWERCKNSYIAERRAVDGGMCEICHERPGVIVHHKVHLTPDNINNPDISLGFSNLQFVCHACHDNIHLYGGKAEIEGMVKLRFGPDGQPVPVG